ncbi:MAG: dimethyl sulfoxide reductase anchor subunit [Xanthomonadales bacterium]|nr:dimethyl sulfoxide reductase anchor subunit [Xanthomonadales bacterium]
MRNKDWTLVIFTTLTQASVGIILCLTLLNYLGADVGPIVQQGLSLKNPVFLAIAFAGIATLISFLHLGSPSNAPNALNNLSGSWISREILALAIYSLSLLVTMVLGWGDWTHRYLAHLLVLNAISGLALLWMMIRIYVMPTIPPWNSWYTGASFVSTAVCLGLLTFLLLSQAEFVGLDDRAGGFLATFLIAVLVIELLAALFHQRRLNQMDTGFDGPILERGIFYRLFLLRMTMLTVSVLMTAFLFLVSGSFPESGQYLWAYALFFLVLVQEFVGRLLFYSSYFRIGV